MNEWQPIETAPKDETKIYGTRILAFFPLEEESDYSSQIVIIRWSYYKRWELAEYSGELDHEFYSQPTHWMPLPNPPKQEKESSK
mgnify:CR=1 FL=1